MTLSAGNPKHRETSATLVDSFAERWNVREIRRSAREGTAPTRARTFVIGKLSPRLGGQGGKKRPDPTQLPAHGSLNVPTCCQTSAHFAHSQNGDEASGGRGSPAALAPGCGTNTQPPWHQDDAFRHFASQPRHTYSSKESTLFSSRRAHKWSAGMRCRVECCAVPEDTCSPPLVRVGG